MAVFYMEEIMHTYKERVEDYAKCLAAVNAARSRIRAGDRLRVSKCPGTKRTITFSHWDDPNLPWMVSKSGVYDYHPVTIEKINGEAVDMTVGWENYVNEAQELVTASDKRREERMKQLEKRDAIPF